MHRLDINVLRHVLFVSFTRKMGPNSTHSLVGLAFIQQYCYHSQVAVLVLVHQVQLHRGMLTIDRCLAHVMKMELDKLIGFALDRYSAAGRVIHLDGVSVVDHLEGEE